MFMKKITLVGLHAKFIGIYPRSQVSVYRTISPLVVIWQTYTKESILRKTMEGYGFYFDFVAKGIIFSTQIVNRYVAEPSLCKHSINFSRCLEALLADLQKRWNTPKIKVIIASYSIQISHSPPLTGSFK